MEDFQAMLGKKNACAGHTKPTVSQAVRPLGDDFLLSQLEQRWLVLHNLSKKQCPKRIKLVVPVKAEETCVS